MINVNRKKKIVLIETGGTIAGSGKAGKANEYTAGSLSVASILETIPAVENMVDLEINRVCSIDSNDITFDHLLKIKEICERLDKDPEVDGIVITHGTDTLEESAFALNLILNVSKPVILTGAMRPATAASADGPMNLYQAIALACNPEASLMGVLAVFSNTIYAGRDLCKTNSIKTDAFKLTEFGTLGFMRDEQVYLLHTPYRAHTNGSEFSKLDLAHIPKVEIFHVHQSADPQLLKYMLEHYDGVVLAGTGSGNYPKTIQEVVESWDGDCVIVRSSRLAEGAVYPSEIFDPQHKTIPAFRIPPHKARILLQLALTETKDPQELLRIFQTY